MSKSEKKTSKTPLSPIFQISKKQRSPLPNLSTVENIVPPYIGTPRSRKWKGARNLIIYTDDFIACRSKLQQGKARFYLSLLRPSNAMEWAVFLPSGPGKYTLISVCCEPRPKNLRVTRLSAVKAIQLVQVLPASLQSLLAHPQAALVTLQMLFQPLERISKVKGLRKEEQRGKKDPLPTLHR